MEVDFAAQVHRILQRVEISDHVLAAGSDPAAETSSGPNHTPWINSTTMYKFSCLYIDFVRPKVAPRMNEAYGSTTASVLCPCRTVPTNRVSFDGEQMMRKIALSIVVLALTSSASAADDPAKAAAAVMPASDAPNWTGFYVGGHVGATWLSDSDMSISDPNLPVPAVLRTVRLSGGSAAHVLGGIQGGYNWQFSPRWVAGIEADFSGSALNNSDSTANLLSNGGLTFPDSALNMSEEVKWLATLRPKVGFLVLPDTLLYATGGLALENVDYNGRSISRPRPVLRRRSMKPT